MSARQQHVCLHLGEETKAQSIRLLDVFVIGPLMMWGGHALNEQGHPLAGPALALMGVATIYYNGRNYFRVRDQIEAQVVGELR